MGIRDVIGKALGKRRKSPLSAFGPVVVAPLVRTPRTDIRATADDAARLLARHDNAQRRAAAAEPRTSMDQPHYDKWWE